MSLRIVDPIEKPLDMRDFSCYLPHDMKVESNSSEPGAAASASVLPLLPQADDQPAPGSLSPCRFCGDPDHESEYWWDCYVQRRTSAYVNGAKGENWFFDEHITENGRWFNGYREQQKAGKELGLFHRTPDSRKNPRLNISEI